MELLLNKFNIKLAPQSNLKQYQNQFLYSFGSYFGHQSMINDAGHIFFSNWLLIQTEIWNTNKILNDL